MRTPERCTLETAQVRLEPISVDHAAALEAAARERLGARKDGVIRHHALHRDGTVRDTVMYSLSAGEWPEVKAQLQYLLAKPRTE